MVSGPSCPPREPTVLVRSRPRGQTASRAACTRLDDRGKRQRWRLGRVRRSSRGSVGGGASSRHGATTTDGRRPPVLAGERMKWPAAESTPRSGISFRSIWPGGGVTNSGPEVASLALVTMRLEPCGSGDVHGCGVPPNRRQARRCAVAPSKPGHRSDAVGLALHAECARRLAESTQRCRGSGMA
jgi:hypothetical protein